MGGKVLEYEAKTILRDGIKQGIEKGIEQGIQKLLQKNYGVKEVAEMLDQDIELVKKIEERLAEKM